MFINGKAYEHADVRVRLFGRTVQGISAINYRDNSAVTVNHMAGREPYSYSRGNSSYEGSVTLELEELQNLREAAAGVKLNSLPPTDIVVVFSPGEGKRDITHTIQQVVFVNDGQESNQGDSTLTTEISFVAGGLKLT